LNTIPITFPLARGQTVRVHRRLGANDVNQVTLVDSKG